MTSAATDIPARSDSTSGFRRALVKNRGALIAALVFALLLGIVDWVSAGPLTYFDISFLSSGGATSAIAAIGQTIVILSGGFDLSAGAVISLVNVVLASLMDPFEPANVFLWTLVGIGVGAAVGAFNGFFIAVLRMQPIVVTLSTMFILQGVTLLVMDKPGGGVSPNLGDFYLGDAITGWLPMPLVVIGVVLLAWMWLKNTRFGTAIYAIGSDPDSAASVGVNVVLTRFLVYVIAGGCYGLAGVFISAQTGSGDPLVGNPLLLSMFAAVVVGGTRLGGGQGGPVGTVFGAYILMMVVNILLVLNVSAYYATVAEGVILILAVLAGSISHGSVLATQLRAAGARLSAWQAGMLPSQLDRTDRRLRLPAATRSARPEISVRPPWHVRNAETLRYALPAYICLVVVVIVTQIWLGRAILNPGYWNSLLVLSSFLAVLALGQGTVILTGGLDLSVPWTIGLSGIILAGVVNGSDVALMYALPLVLLMSLVIGFANGVGIVYLGISPIVMTLAMNGILQGAALLYSQGTPAGFSAPLLRSFMTGRFLGMTPVVPVLVLFIIGAVVLLSRTPFGRRVYGIGNGERAARLSGISVEKTLILVYMLSAFCAGLVGVMLTGFSGQASLGMGDEYLLPSIAVVVVGGALITGGRGHYMGMLGGALLLTALQMLLAGTTLPYATRAILYGLVVLGAVMALRERRGN
jgi:Ribose/xylose/arabinose/galactoside ABC-type transport systems, permease components